MKYISKIFALCILMVAFASCKKGAIHELEGVYNYIVQSTATKATVGETVKVGKGIKQLNVTLEDGTNKVELHMYSSEWILPATQFIIGSDDVESHADKTASVVFNGTNAVDGTITITMVNDHYYIVVYATDGKKTAGVRCLYEGALEFIVGEDDPEPSGITFKVTEAPVEYFDWSTFQNVTVPGMSYYSVNISNAASKEIAMLKLVDASGKKMADLVGSYTVVGSAVEAGKIDAGYATEYEGVVYEGGTYFTDDAGVMQYITAGSVTIETVQSVDDKPLYTFTGTALDIAASGTAATATGASFKIMFTEEESNEIPVASGYTIKYTVTNPVSVTTDGQNYTDYPNLDRIDIECKDAAGNPAGYFSLVVDHGTAITDITGSYDIVSGATEAGKCEAGVCFPGWNVMWYTYVMDEGIAKYANAGTVVVKVAKDAEGKDLYNIKYSGVTAVWSPNGTYGADWTDIDQSTDLAGEVPFAVIAE